MKQIEKNTVEAKDQLNCDGHFFYENKNGKGKRVLFVGNSITLHGYKPDIGWYGENYGMAASSREKDYAHLVMSEIQKHDRDAVMCIAQISDFERDYKNADAVLHKHYGEASSFGADIIIFRFSENIPFENYEGETFREGYNKLINYFNKSGKAKIIITTSFWKHIADEDIVSVARQNGIEPVYIGDLGEDDSMKAIGLFEHSGVANHPGDLGMQMIADRIIRALRGAFAE